jgi:DNA-binding IclR family transcriptional regulator
VSAFDSTLLACHPHTPPSGDAGGIGQLLSMSKEEDTKQVRAARRALDIIEAVAAARQLKHTDIAARLDIPKSSTTLILDTLVRSGYLRRDPLSRAYSLGSRILGIAGRYLSEADIVQVSQPVLSQLVTDIDESCFLVQAEGDEVIVLWREVCKRRLTYTFALGERAPILDTAGGLALLALRGASTWQPCLERHGIDAPQEAQAILSQLQEIADGAVAVRAQGRIHEVTSLALPITNAAGQPLAALSVAVPAHRLDAQLQPRVELALRAARDEIADQARMLGPQMPSP